MLRQLLPVLSLFLSAAFLLVGGGLQGILVPVRGQIEGFSAFQIGWIGTGYAVGFTLGCYYIPRLVRRVGHIRTFSSLCALLAIVILITAMIVDAFSWVLLRAVAGFCFAGCYMVLESWLNERMTNESRGTIFSIYMIVTQIAMMAGQYLLVAANPEKETLFMVGAIIYALALMPIAMTKAQSPRPLTQVSLDLNALIQNSPVAAVGCILAGIISSAWGNFAPVYGREVGMTSAGIATLLAVAMVGSVLFQFPIGKLSDRMDRRYMMVATGIFGGVLGLLLAYIGESEVNTLIFYVALICYGGVIYSIYGLNVAHANDHSDAGDFVKISGGLLILYGFGTMVGPLFTAQLMAFFGSTALFSATTIAHFAYAGFAFYRIFQRETPVDDEQVDYQVSPLAKVQTPETYNIDPRSNPDPAELGEEG